MSSDHSIPLLLLLSAPSGGGKTTVAEQLLATIPNLTRVVTCTTRPPRRGERDGVDYHFLDARAFAGRVQAEEFLEHATVYGNCYGTLQAELMATLRAGQDVLLGVDVQGAASIRARAAEDQELRRSLVTVFLTPVSLAELEARLRKRGKDSEEVIRRRAALAHHEIAQWYHFDYLVLSTTVAEDLRRVRVIYEAEKMRQARSAAPLAALG